MTMMSSIFTCVSEMAATVLSKLSPLISTQTILIGAVVIVAVYKLTKKRYKYPPGPRGLPILGSLLALRKKDVQTLLLEWTEKYGPVFTVDIGPMRTVYLNSVEVMHEAFVKKAADFAGRPFLYSVYKKTEEGKDLIFADYSPTWRLHRKLAVRALSQYMKGSNLVNTIDDVLKMMFAELRKETGAFDMQNYTQHLIFSILSKICFDEKFGKNDEEYLTFIGQLKQIGENFGNGYLEDVIPPLRLWPTKRFQSTLNASNGMLSFIYKRIHQHKRTFSPDVQRDLTDAMLIAQKELAEEESAEVMETITDTHFGQTIADVFEAGIDTSRQTLYWTILYIAANPEVQAKIHQEVDSVLVARVTPLMSDRPKLPYMEAVLCEGMRLGTVAILTAPHTTTCDTSIGEYTLPKGTMVFGHIFAIHRDPKLWDEPEKFKPERFLDSSGRMKPKPEAWMPFSLGKRACLAEPLVTPELVLILAGLYRNFEIRMPEGVTADVTPKTAQLILLPKDYKVVIKDRLA